MEASDTQNWTRWLVRTGASFSAKRLFRDGPKHCTSPQASLVLLTQRLLQKIKHNIETFLITAHNYYQLPTKKSNRLLACLVSHVNHVFRFGTDCFMMHLYIITSKTLRPSSHSIIHNSNKIVCTPLNNSAKPSYR